MPDINRLQHNNHIVSIGTLFIIKQNQTG